jgi:hypothetical protein
MSIYINRDSNSVLPMSPVNTGRRAEHIVVVNVTLLKYPDL